MKCSQGRATFPDESEGTIWDSGIFSERGEYSRERKAGGEKRGQLGMIVLKPEGLGWVGAERRRVIGSRRRLESKAP